MYLYLLIEMESSGYKTLFLFLLSLISIFFAIMIVAAKNPVVSVLYLIGLFTAISLYLMALGMYFVGLSYLLVYVGAISILFLFILMLLNVRVSELLTEGVNSVPLAIIAVLVFSFNINNMLPHYLYTSDAFSKYVQKAILSLVTMFYLGTESIINKLVLIHAATIEAANVNSKLWDGSLVDINHITSIGNILYSNLFILLIIISLILLLAMVGTIIITTKRETNSSVKSMQSSLGLILITTNGVTYIMRSTGLSDALTSDYLPEMT